MLTAARARATETLVNRMMLSETTLTGLSRLDEGRDKKAVGPMMGGIEPDSKAVPAAEGHVDRRGGPAGMPRHERLGLIEPFGSVRCV